MSSYQSKLETASLKASYKLHDHHIVLIGKSSNALRIRLQEDYYGDTTSYEIIKQDTPVVYINYPSDIPLSRYRNANVQKEKPASTGIFLIDVLPIEVYTDWADNIEVDDYLIDIHLDEEDNKIKIPLIVTEIKGDFGINYLKYKKLHAAIYNDGFDEDVQSIIDNL